MTAEESRYEPSSAGFPVEWVAHDLGSYRPSPFTYRRYPYADLPPLDPARFTGGYQWLGGVGDPLPREVARLERLAGELAGRGLTLPDDFVTYFTAANLHDAMDRASPTGCWSQISDPLECPGEPDAALVLFLQDQQACVHWYLCLRPSGEAFVVHSPQCYEPEPDQLGYAPDPAQMRAEIRWCAPSFEEFAFRTWAEGRIWFAIHRDEDLAQLDPPLRDYLRHYAPDLA